MNTAFVGAALLEASSIGSTLSLCITASIICSVLFGILWGLKRGMYKTAIRMITIGASAILSYHAVRMFTNYMHGLFVDQTVEGVITGFWPGYSSFFDENTRNIINSFDAVTVERLLATLTVIVLVPIIFIAIFLVLSSLTVVLHFIFCGIFRIGRRKSLVSILMGGFLGALQGLLIAGVTLIPVAGLAGMASDAREGLIKDKAPDISANIESAYVNYLDEVCNNPMLRLVRRCGGDALFDAITTVTVGEDTVDMQKEAIVLVEIIADGMPLIDGEFNQAQLRDTDKQAMRDILSDVGGDEYTANTVAGVLRGIATANKNGSLDFGFEYPFNDFMNEFLQVFSDSDKTNVEGDLATFLDVYFILNDYQVLQHFDGALEDSTAEALLAADADGDTVISKITGRLSENPRTQPLVTSLTKFSLKLMAESAGNVLPDGMDADQVYEDVKVGMKDVLASVNDESIPEEEKHEAVKESLNNTLIESGVITEDTPLSEDAMNSLTDYVMENYTGKEELTDDDINNAIFAYYTKQGTTPPEGTIPEGTLPEGIIPDGGTVPEGTVPEGSEPILP